MITAFHKLTPTCLNPLALFLILMMRDFASGIWLFIYFFFYYFPTFRLTGDCRKTRTRKTPNADTFHAVYPNKLLQEEEIEESFFYCFSLSN